MTERKHFKQLVRSRMEKTGESYSTARRQLVRQTATAAPTLPQRQHFPGSIPATQWRAPPSVAISSGG
jgi:hypothetical protein